MSKRSGQKPPAAGVAAGRNKQAAAGEALEVTALRGVGPALAARLERLNIRLVRDLLFHLPARYEDRTAVVPIGRLLASQRAVIEGTVDHAEVVFRRRRALLVRISDGTGALTLRFFHFSKAQQASLRRGLAVRVFGEVRDGPGGREIVHPEYRLLQQDAPVQEPYLTAVYPVTEGVTQGRVRALVAQALQRLPTLALEDCLEPYLPAQMMPLAQALELLHRPPADTDIKVLEAGEHPAQHRLSLEELLAHHLSLRGLRAQVRSEGALALHGDGALVQRWLSNLPFTPTGAQSRVIEEIFTDLADTRPMLRLVQGDVGAGKTVVAAAAVLRAIEAGFQAAVMAPTELLAEQHLSSFAEWLTPLDIEVVRVSGRMKAAPRRASLSALGQGSAGLAVGTHALFSEGVEFDRLGLVIIDEQHRFGVHQRLALRDKGVDGGRLPHQLTMTATPIPRTLAMTAYADLDVSILDELPPGRTPVKTVVLPESRRADVVMRIRDACRDGRQAYWVCPLIEESELLDAQAAEETCAALSEALPELRIMLLHGRMSGPQKEQVMQTFKAGDADMLVATTVIEVGVDVANASLMVIENAERMGLAQLHQLRGRVGRGAAASSCVLMYQAPLSQLARERLRVMRETNDGFVVANRDLELRGPGEVLGTRQTGLMQMRVADLVRDASLLPQVQDVADVLMAQAPEVAATLIQRWVGESARYGEV